MLSLSKNLVVVGALLAAVATSFAPAPAEARKRPAYGEHHHGQWEDRWKKRRDARRTGIVTGVVVGSVAGAAGRSKAEQRYEECLSNGNYDYDCERRRFQDEQRARQGARRAGVTAGIVAHSIARD